MGVFTAHKQEDLTYSTEPNVIQVSEFGNKSGKYISLMSTEETTLYDTEKSRKKITASYIKHRTSGQIDSIIIEQFIKNKSGVSPTGKINIALGVNAVDTLQSFLDFLIKSDLAAFQDGSRFYDKKLPVDRDTYRKLVDLANENGGRGLIKSFIETEFTQEDIVSIGYRRKEKEKFSRLLNEPTYLQVYKTEENLTAGTSEEKIRQHFFNKNAWIFGYGLDYRFLDIVGREGHIGIPNVEGANGPIVDFLLGCSNFTVLVEIKKPTTPLFSGNRDRAGSWKVSLELVHAISQVLGQKSARQIKSASNPFINGQRISQQTADCKTILLIGRSSDYEGDDEESHIKRQTFELLRRDSRNIEILTFDELYKRAEFIVR